jgi:hypothetical protein
LPPGGVIDKFEMSTIRGGGKIVGYAETYCGYPDDGTVYFPLLYLAERGRGFETAAITRLLECFGASGFSKSRFVVLLANVCAIKFWYKMGFDKITKITLGAVENMIELEKT